MKFSSLLIQMLSLAPMFAVTGPAWSAANTASVPFHHLDLRELPIAAGVMRSQDEWDAAIREAYKDGRTTPARSHPVNWKNEMVVAAPAFVSFVQQSDALVTVFVVGDAPTGVVNRTPYLIALPSSRRTVRFEKDPAIAGGPYFVASAAVNHYIGKSKTVILFPSRSSGSAAPRAWNDTIYTALGDAALARVAGELKMLGFHELPVKSTDRAGRGEGWSAAVTAVTDGLSTTASYDGVEWANAPKALRAAVRTIFSAGGSPGLPELPSSPG